MVALSKSEMRTVSSPPPTAFTTTHAIFDTLYAVHFSTILSFVQGVDYSRFRRHMSIDSVSPALLQLRQIRCPRSTPCNLPTGRVASYSNAYYGHIPRQHLNTSTTHIAFSRATHLEAGISPVDAEPRVPLQHGREPFVGHIHPEVLSGRLHLPSNDIRSKDRKSTSQCIHNLFSELHRDFWSHPVHLFSSHPFTQQPLRSGHQTGTSAVLPANHRGIEFLR